MYFIYINFYTYYIIRRFYYFRSKLRIGYLYTYGWPRNAGLRTTYSHATRIKDERRRPRRPDVGLGCVSDAVRVPLVTSQDCAKSLTNMITAHSDSVRARGWPPEAGLRARARAHRAFDVNSASLI